MIGRPVERTTHASASNVVLAIDSCYGLHMDFGIALPTSGSLASPANIARMAQEAERLDYASIWTYERLLRPLAKVQTRRGGLRILGEDTKTCYEPLETLSYVAALTSRVKLGTSVINALFHPPVVLARRLATLDQFSGGRVIAGLGQGWMPQEFETVNVPITRRGSGLDDVVGAIRACWSADPVEYSGRFYKIPPSEINPKPMQNMPPILIGAMTPAGVRRAARFADGLNVIADSFEVVESLVNLFIESVKDAGRDPAEMIIVVRANTVLSHEPVHDRPFLTGTPAQVAEDVARLQGTPVKHILFDNENPTGDLATEIELYQELRGALAAYGD
jgi:probable F420-dependent oxidoreductase